ncbi:hypothetical protein C8R43DRAFT_1134903 [Mycena crocata]|nr:hypothetical protein C8R43DRAFT_1134903 [Mycena crocata]
MDWAAGEAAMADNEQWQDVLEDLMFAYGEITDDLDDDVREELDEERRTRVVSGEEDAQRAEAALEREDHEDGQDVDSEGARRFLALRERRDASAKAAADSKARMEAEMQTMQATGPVEPAGEKKKATRGSKKRKRTSEEEDVQGGDTVEPPARKTRSSRAAVVASEANRSKPKPAWRWRRRQDRGDDNGFPGNGSRSSRIIHGAEYPACVSSVDVTMDVRAAERPDSAGSVQAESGPVPFGRRGLLIHGADGRLHRAAEATAPGPAQAASSLDLPDPTKNDRSPEEWEGRTRSPPIT